MFANLLIPPSKKTFPKDRFIESIPDASEKDKQRYKAFFQTYRQAESQIKWNNSRNLTKSYFDEFLNNYLQQKNVYYQFQTSDFNIIGENKKYLFVQILTYNGAQYVNSFKCGGQGAKWCIGDSYSIQKWIEPIENNRILVLAYNKEEVALENERKYMLEYIPYHKKIIAHHQTDNPLLRIYDKEVYKKFFPPFKFKNFPFSDAKKHLTDFYSDVLLNFLDCYENYFDQNGNFNNGKNIEVTLISPIKTYNNLTVNDTIFLIIKTLSEVQTENPLFVEISSDIYIPVKFKTSFGSFMCEIQLFNDYVITNIVAYANYGKKIEELLKLQESIRSKNFINFLNNYDSIKNKQKELTNEYNFEYKLIYEIILQIQNKNGNDVYELSDFSYIEKLNVNKDFHIFRFRKDTDRFSIDYGSFSQDFKVHLSEDNYYKLAELLNYLRGLSELKVKASFYIIKIDFLGNIIKNNEIVNNIQKLMIELNSELETFDYERLKNEEPTI